MTTIILLSLLEQRSATDPMNLSMRRSIQLDVLKENLVYIYYLYQKEYNKFLTTENLFRVVEEGDDRKAVQEMIVEVGFNIYFLMERWSENKENRDAHLD